MNTQLKQFLVFSVVLVALALNAAQAQAQTVLLNGVPETGLSATEHGEIHFVLDIPWSVDARNLELSLSGGTGDADLYVKKGASPTLTDYDCVSDSSTNDETCSFDSPAYGGWYVMVYAFAGFSDVSLLGSFSRGNCLPGPNHLCLNQERFRIEVEWRDFQGNIGSGRPVPIPSGDFFEDPRLLEDSGLLWFFGPDNWEMLVKVLDGCGFNDHFWVFAAATTNVGYTLRVTDTETGAVKVYPNPLGNAAAALTDTGAFETCP